MVNRASDALRGVFASAEWRGRGFPVVQENYCTTGSVVMELVLQLNALFF